MNKFIACTSAHNHNRSNVISNKRQQQIERKNGEQEKLNAHISRLSSHLSVRLLSFSSRVSFVAIQSSSVVVDNPTTNVKTKYRETRTSKYPMSLHFTVYFHFHFYFYLFGLFRFIFTEECIMYENGKRYLSIAQTLISIQSIKITGTTNNGCQKPHNHFGRTDSIRNDATEVSFSLFVSFVARSGFGIQLQTPAIIQITSHHHRRRRLHCT